MSTKLALYILECLPDKDKNLEPKLAAEISALILDSFKRNVASEEVKAWIKQKLDRLESY